MQLQPGTQLGAYRIVAGLGSGGMGEVYRARQDGLDRDVAIKLLPARLRSDPAALQRFEREAKVLAGLSHPNIVAIYDFVRLPGNSQHRRSESGDALERDAPAPRTPGSEPAGHAEGALAFAVTELLDGRTLRARLDEGLPPARKALDWAAQAARGLAAAHERGVVHRDLKPDNLFVTVDGQVKILDFGLARQNWPGFDPQAGAAEGNPTLSRLTEPGTVMGTVGYMSPEQVRGREADARSDIFSLGAVLYELLSGRRAFQRDTAAETLTAILKEDPPELSRTRPALPAGLERIVTHCLEKRPEERFQSARDLAFDLQSFADAASGTSSPRVGLRVDGALRSRLVRGLGAAALLILAFAAGRGTAPRPARAPRGALPERFTLVTDRPGVESQPSLSPDGSQVAFVRESDGQSDIHVQRVGGRNSQNLTKDSARDDWAPAFSPDGQRLAFRSERDGGGIFVMGATGESVRRLTDFGFDPAWTPDGRALIVAGEAILNPSGRSGRASALWRVDVQNGHAERVFEGDAVQPSVSPNGRRVAFWAVPPGTGQRDVWTLALDGRAAPVRVTDDAAVDWNPVWSRDGRALYFASDRGGTMNLWRVAIDEQTGAVQGRPEAVTTPVSGLAFASLARDGSRLAYAGIHVVTRLSRAAFDPRRGVASGALEPVLELSREFWMPDVSPDGSQIVLGSAGPREDLYLVGADGKGFTQLTDDEARDRGPRFSPDGRRIAFYSNRDGRYAMWVVERDGSGLRRVSPPEPAVFGAGTWSDDGTTLALPGIPSTLARLEGDAVRFETLPRLDTQAQFMPMRFAAGELLGMAYADAPRKHLGFWAFSLERRVYRKLFGVPGEPPYAGLELIDSRRALTVRDGRLIVVDLVSGSAHDVGLPRLSARHSGEWRLSRDGRYLVLLERVTDADIWVADLR